MNGRRIADLTLAAVAVTGMREPCPDRVGAAPGEMCWVPPDQAHQPR